MNAEEELKMAYDRLKGMQEQLVRIEKFKAIGQLASNVAHEVRNPLAVILQGINYLERKLSFKEKDNIEVMDIIKANIQRANKVIALLMDFSQERELVLQPQNINSILIDALTLVKTKDKFKDINIIMETSEELPELLVDKNKIEQVFMNELLNAFEAMPKGGKLIIRSYIQQDKIDNFRKAGKKKVIVEIEDTGIGIPEENLEKIFEPFFSTKRLSGGTGLGLAVSKCILDMHEVSIKIKSTVGKGTNIIMIFNNSVER